MKVNLDFNNFKPREEFLDQMRGAVAKWKEQFIQSGECKIMITEKENEFSFDFEFRKDLNDNGQECNIRIRKKDMYGMPRDWMIFVLVVYMDYLMSNLYEANVTASNRQTRYAH